MKSLLVCLLLVALAAAAPSGNPKFRRGRGKIVGGTDVAPGEIPFQISFQDTSFGDNFHFCGGSVYTEEFMITAAHCVAGEDFENPANLRIVAGEHSLSKEEGTEQAVAVIRIIQHESFSVRTMANDIALLQVEPALIFNDFVSGVVLPEPNQPSYCDSTVSGWGTTTEGGSSPDILQVVTVPIVDDETCRVSYGIPDIFDSMICAGLEGRDSCQGDSGGPLICRDFDTACKGGDSSYLCGIVSWGYGCARPYWYGVYTEVSYFVDWIHKHTSTHK